MRVERNDPAGDPPSHSSDLQRDAFKQMRLAVVTNGAAGWATVRKRWVNDLADAQPRFYHIEDYLRTLTGVTERYGPKSLGHCLAGRAAASAAIRDGANVVLLSNVQNAPLAPLKKGVRYVVYGDCTTRQLAQLYGGKELGFPGSWLNARLRRLADHGAAFLCMSEWHRAALRDEYGVAEDQLALLPFYVDADRWAPLADKPRNPRRQILFIGAGLYRKGGDIVYEMARMPQFRDVDFHIVAPDAEGGPANLHPHRALHADSPELIALVQRCDLFLLPTRADTSSIAALEAASCGLPAIIAGRGGIGEIVVNGVTGSVLPESRLDAFAAELARYLADPALLEQRGRAARAHATNIYSKARHMTILHAALARAEAEALADAARPRFAFKSSRRAAPLTAER